MRYFLDRGRHLYSSLFFNHQFLVVYLSYALQHITHSETMLRVVSLHRVFMIVFSAIAAVLLVVRFGLPALGFVITYEFFKYYSFGFTFQAESMIVYPIVYLFGLIWISFKNKKTVFWFDFIFAAISAWFCIYMREPYIPLTLFLFGYLMWRFRKNTIAIASGIVFVLTSLATLLLVPFGEYIRQVFVLNSKVAADELKGMSPVVQVMLRLFYPFVLFFGWDITYFRFLLILQSIVLIYGSYWYISWFGRWKEILFICITLFLAAVRFIPPGMELYAGYRLLVWFALLVASVMFLICDADFMKRNYAFKKYLLVFYVLVTVVLMISPWSFVWQKIDRHTEFHINYTPYFIKGQLVRELASPGDSFYVDGYDSLMYWQTGMDSPYKYALFYPVMIYDQDFIADRNKMFTTRKPTFVFKECIGNYPRWNVYKKNYVEMKQGKGGVCFFIRKDKLKSLTQQQMESVNKYGFHF